MFNQFLYKLPIAKVIFYSIIVFIEYAELKLLSQKGQAPIHSRCPKHVVQCSRLVLIIRPWHIDIQHR